MLTKVYKKIIPCSKIEEYIPNFCNILKELEERKIPDFLNSL